MPHIPWAGDTGVPPGQGVGTNLVVWLLGRVPGALCTPLPPAPLPGAQPSLPDLLRIRWGQGQIVQLHSGRRGLGGDGWGHGQSWPCGTPASVALGLLTPILWGSHGVWMPGKLWGPPRHPACSSVPISPHTWVREPPEKGLQGASLGHPPRKPRSRKGPAPAKAAPGHPHRHPMGCLGVPLEPARAGPGRIP